MAVYKFLVCLLVTIVKAPEPSVTNDARIITGQLNDDVMFEWHYAYEYPAVAIAFTRYLTTPEQSLNVGYWKDQKFVPDLDGGDDRLGFEKIDEDWGGNITLILHNTIKDDFRYTYGCKIFFKDRKSEYSVIILTESVEVDPSEEPQIIEDGSFGGVDDEKTKTIGVVAIILGVLFFISMALFLMLLIRNLWRKRHHDKPYVAVQENENKVRDDEEYVVQAAKTRERETADSVRRRDVAL